MNRLVLMVILLVGVIFLMVTIPEENKPENLPVVEKKEVTISNENNNTSVFKTNIGIQKTNLVVAVPKLFTWAAYNEQGKLLDYGKADFGKKGHATKTGTYTFYMKRGGKNCVSYKYKAKIPYCVFYYKGFAIHAHKKIYQANVSHGCVRVTMDKAKWLHDSFIKVGYTKITLVPHGQIDKRYIK